MEDINWIYMIKKMSEIRLFSRTLIHRSSSDSKISAQEYDLLSQLITSDEGVTPINLSKAMCLNKTIVSRLIDKLSKDGCVTKIQDEHDKRSYFVCITECGREELKKIYEFYLSPIYELREKLGNEDFLQLISYIEKANEAMTKK